MSDFYFIAVLTYGKEKHGDKSDFKLGRGAGLDVLLTLFGNRAREFVSPRASYRYINLDVKGASIYKSYLVLRITPDEKTQVETICRKIGSYPWVYLWEHETRRWLEFPCAPQAHYIDPSSYGGACPKFPPTHAKFITPSQLTAAESTVAVPSSVTLTQSGDWWWIAGDTYSHRDVLRAAGAKWSKSRREWYYKGRHLPQAIRDLAAQPPNPSQDTIDQSSLAQNSATPNVQSTEGSTVNPEPLSDIQIEVPLIEPKPDTIQRAIQRMKDVPKTMTTYVSSNVKRGMANITQEYVGELTGSITGNVQCFGYAVHLGICVFLNFGGPRTAVEAIRAKFSKGEMISCVPWDKPATELTPGEGNIGMYTAYMQNIPEARYTSVILLHEQITSPNYGGKSWKFILRTDEAQGVALLKHHVQQLVKIPVFDTWADYLWDAGEIACLVTRPQRAGGIDLWAIELDVDAWTRLICGGLQAGVIELPQRSDG